MNNMDYTMLFTLITIVAYMLGYMVYKKKHYVWVNPVFTSTAIVITFLLFSHTDYKVYEAATKPIYFFLGPLQVAMVIPLFKYFKLLKKHLVTIVLSVGTGSLAGIISAFVVGKFLELDLSVLLSMIPKSVTAPIAVEASKTLGGIPELTGMFVIFTGIFGMTIGPCLLSWVGIKNNVVKGLALGTTAQMIGAVEASKWGEAEGAMGMIGMIITALMVGITAPMLTILLL